MPSFEVDIPTADAIREEYRKTDSDDRPMLGRSAHLLITLHKRRFPDSRSAVEFLNAKDEGEKVAHAQDKILGIVRKKIAETGFEAIDIPQFANTGVIGIERDCEFGQLARVNYSFQDGTFTLALYIVGDDGRERGVPSQPPRQGYFDFYMQYSDRQCFQKFLDALDKELGKLAEDEPPQSNGARLAWSGRGIHRGQMHDFAVSFTGKSIIDFLMDGRACEFRIPEPLPEGGTTSNIMELARTIQRGVDLAQLDETDYLRVGVIVGELRRLLAKAGR